MCDVCNSAEPSVHVHLRHNVGMLFMRREYETQGRLCASCLKDVFRRHQVNNLLLGWWGVISFVLTWFYLIDNTRDYLAARKELAQLGQRRDSSRFVPEGTPSERLARFRHNVRLRLRREEAVERIVADLMSTHDVPRADAEAFVRDIENESELAAAPAPENT
ncbi:MAG: hypothetical protein K0R38_5672 [Polyangiaceae bacterium]|nr:hypothetical protein [Polyangiaceae bacterium]